MTATATIERKAPPLDLRSTGAQLRPPSPNSEEARPGLRLSFKYVNRYFMVPVFRLGLGWAMGSPTGGYVMLLKTVGKKSGKTRYAPVNYAIMEGNVYC